METTPIQPRSVILAVDDDEDDIDIMRLLFRKAGVAHPVQVYRRGEDLIDALTEVVKSSVKAVMPLLCFLDVKMPSLTGHDLLAWIRKEPKLDQMSVVMLSGSEHPADIEQAAQSGAQCYLSKYPQPDVLRKVIEEAERVAVDAANEWFGVKENLLLRWRGRNA